MFDILTQTLPVWIVFAIGIFIGLVGYYYGYNDSKEKAWLEGYEAAENMHKRLHEMTHFRDLK